MLMMNEWINGIQNMQKYNSFIELADECSKKEKFHQKIIH